MALAFPSTDHSSGYKKAWGPVDHKSNTHDDRVKRNEKNFEVVDSYYDFATSAMLSGWGSHFHFCPLQPNESFNEGLIRHSRFMALMIELKPGMRVLDLGCGVGGPARQIARFAGVHITGVNLHKYQLHLAREATKEAKLDGFIDYVECNFMDLPFENDSFDAVYAVEATCHAPVIEGVYREAYRVLKPGGLFGTYEFGLADLYDDDNATHRELRNKIELGNGIPHLNTPKECLDALDNVGFELIYHKDLGIPDAHNPVPWWYPISGSFSTAKTFSEKVTIFFLRQWPAKTMLAIYKGLSLVGLFPKEFIGAIETMHLGVFTERIAGEMGIFTSDYLIVGRKAAVGEVKGKEKEDGRV